ncbi:MAG: CCA tRNA nucleotidyltransferase [Saprospiraceae bacterium]|nr:CCA tRNA nucleotidyltransferase [Saprospiraceae bacterium]HMW39446.1 CCA tRNA nucleotidyltransferase [Saprospiraceae bacterium]HMX87261.1 CCA tRNA nucleotidyltransferase [Saprospiraceae bacterium]HMZ38660.1 CCA tRNA nucleotidyltransferase [Saprospiraceae bacterium]HNA64531.1 CCA tRNA nucleotidyltransferase [Saprospiraceae bacterium]
MAEFLFKLSSSERKIFEIISGEAVALGSPAYAVGGYVRDKLIGRPSKDIDIVCVGDAIRLASGVASRLRPIPQVNYFSRFGTAMIRHHDLEIEFVGARKESYVEDSRKPDISPGTLEDDQLRRDFSINAISISLNPDDFGQLIDPFNGLEDLNHQVIRTPNNPDITFSDDPLRMMRAIRFASQLGYQIEENTWQGIRRNIDRIKIISKERISSELEKIILSPVPSVGFKLLFDCGLLHIIFPELVALQGVEHQEGKAHKDNFYHTLQVLDNVSAKSKNIWLLWSALLHDIAKPQTKKFEHGTGWTFHGHDALGAAMVPRIFRNFKLPLDHKMKFVQKMVRLHLRPIALTQEEITDSAVRRLLFDAGIDLEELLLLCEADITSKNPDKVRRYLENYARVRQRLHEVEESDRIREWQPPVTGEMIMKTFGIKPCPAIGVIKNAIREAILEGEVPNDFEPAFELMLKKGLELGLVPVNFEK